MSRILPSTLTNLLGGWVSFVQYIYLDKLRERESALQVLCDCYIGASGDVHQIACMTTDIQGKTMILRLHILKPPLIEWQYATSILPTPQPYQTEIARAVLITKRLL